MEVELKAEAEHGVSEALLRHIFETFDINGDGGIEVKELEIMLAWLGEYLEPTERKLLEDVAGDDGQIDFDEFKGAKIGRLRHPATWGPPPAAVRTRPTSNVRSRSYGFANVHQIRELFCAVRTEAAHRHTRIHRFQTPPHENVPIQRKSATLQ